MGIGVAHETKTTQYCGLIFMLNRYTALRYDEVYSFIMLEASSFAMATPSRARHLPYAYPEHLRMDVQKAPVAPGVYLFFGEYGRVPLYIGKSVNLRARLNSHLRNRDEARLLHQARRITFIRTAGEISALLLEARLIKERQPLFNRRLRRQGSLSSILVDDNSSVSIVPSKQVRYGRDPRVHGLFRNQKKARDLLLALADEHRLCLGIMGLDPLVRDRGCFRASIGKCGGACRGQESIDAHRERLLTALAHHHVALWPHDGPVALCEHHDELVCVHVLDHWHYMGSFASVEDARRGPWQGDERFDADIYKITVKPLLSADADIVAVQRPQ